MPTENLELDAVLVKASAEGGFDKFMFTARSLDLKPNEAVTRAKWLKSKRKQKYADRVAKRVVNLILSQNPVGGLGRKH